MAIAAGDRRRHVMVDQEFEVLAVAEDRNEVRVRVLGDEESERWDGLDWMEDYTEEVPDA